MLKRHKLKKRRIEMNLTQEQVAKLAEIERTRYTKIENGKIIRVSLRDAYAIAKALETTIENLFQSELLTPTGTQDT